MKLLCINADAIIIDSYNCIGEGLVEGEEYNTRGGVYLDKYGLESYYIDGLGDKLACRFIPVLEEATFSKKQLEELSLN
jgi:hypothetical protein